MATTKDRLDELTSREPELDDHDVVAPEDGAMADAEVPPAAAGNGPAVGVLRTSLRGRLLEPLSGRWAAIGAVAWVVLLGIGIAVEPQPTNPTARGLHRRVPSVRPPHPARRLVGRPARLRARAGDDQRPWPAAGLNRARRRDRLPLRRLVKAVRAGAWPQVRPRRGLAAGVPAARHT
jgi:hypothetical protein